MAGVRTTISYSFTALFHADFEDLSRDLMWREPDILLKPRPDGGLDGRHAQSSHKIVIQALHYSGSSYYDLKRSNRSFS